MLAYIKGLTGKSAVYGLGSIALRAISFLLLPLYTRFLTPADYGVMAVTGTLVSVLGIILPLSLHGAVARFYFLTRTEDERQSESGTIWLAMVLNALFLTLLLDRVGDTVFPLLFRDVPFSPYIRLAIWTAFFSTLGVLPLAFFQVQERPVAYVLTTVSVTLLTIGLVINFVVLQGQGAYGYLRGVLLAQVLFAVPYVALTLRNVRITLRWNVLQAALAFSLPLVPHGLAGWALELSDRAILQRYVSLEQLGLYSLGYKVGTIVSLFATAFNFAWVPFLYKIDAERGEAAKPDLARLATYYALFLCFAALALGLFVKPIIVLMTTPAFYPSFRVALWIVGGLLFSGLYYIPVNFLFLRQRTKAVPLVTVTAAIVNVALNIWLVPVFGIMAAAWATFVAYALMLILVWGSALRVYTFPYEYRRLGLIALTTASLFALGTGLRFDSVALDLGAKAALLLVYPIMLGVLGFFTQAEKEKSLALARQMLGTFHRVIHSP